jgi:tripartite-type tricarboxylate transporter receptor subunit TctC
MRRMKWMYGVVALLAVCFLTPAQAADFPTKDISGIIQWGAGGATDNVSRATTPYVEKALGKQIVLQNKPGATGAVGLMSVYNQPADGYTLLYGAENPTLYKVLDISQIDYDAFYPVMLIARNVGVIVCNNDQPWKTLGDLFADAKKNPGQLKMGSTGPGGLPHVVSSMLKATSGVTFNQIVYQGEGPLTTAILGGHIQWTTMGMAAVREHLRAGRVRALAVVSDTPVPTLESVPLITATSADYKKFLPWGPFYGVFV